MRECLHRQVTMRTQEQPSPSRERRDAVVWCWYECAQCGAREPFVDFTALTAEEYNKTAEATGGGER